MVPLSHSEQVVSMFHQPLYLDRPQNMEFTLKPKSGRSGPTPSHQLQQSFHCRAPGTLQVSAERPLQSQPSPAHTEVHEVRGMSSHFFCANPLQALKKGPGRGVSQTGHWEPPLERSPGSWRKTVLTFWIITAGNWVLLHLLVQTSLYCLHFYSGLYRQGEAHLWHVDLKEMQSSSEYLPSFYLVFTAPPAVPRSSSHL